MSAVTVRQVQAALDELAPPQLAETWDNTGLLLGDPAALCDKVLLTIDLSPEVIEEAGALGASCVIAYHPPLFRPQKTVLRGDLAYLALRAGLHVISPHTALDAAPGGTNEVMAQRLGLVQCAPLLEQAPGLGQGRVGALPQALDEAAFVAHCKQAFGVSQVLLAGACAEVRRVLVAAGSGGGLLDAFFAQPIDAVLTGELSHHDALRVRREGRLAVMLRHSVSERPALQSLQQRLAARLPVAVEISARDADPLRFA